MASSMGVFDWPVRVYIEDTDAGGIVYYINYLKFMERARTEYLRQLGFDKSYIFNADLMFVVQTVNINYVKPAQLDDNLRVTACVANLAAASLLMEQFIFRGDELLCSAEVRIVCVSRSSVKPKRIPQEMYSALNKERC